MIGYAALFSRLAPGPLLLLCVAAVLMHLGSFVLLKHDRLEPKHASHLTIEAAKLGLVLGVLYAGGRQYDLQRRHEFAQRSEAAKELRVERASLRSLQIQSQDRQKELLAASARERRESKRAVERVIELERRMRTSRHTDGTAPDVLTRRSSGWASALAM